MVERDPETVLNNRRALASAVNRPVKIERLFCPHGHRNMMMQATPQQSLDWKCSTFINSGLSLDGRMRCSNVDPESFDGVDGNMVL